MGRQCDGRQKVNLNNATTKILTAIQDEHTPLVPVVVVANVAIKLHILTSISKIQRLTRPCKPKNVRTTVYQAMKARSWWLCNSLSLDQGPRKQELHIAQLD